MKQRLAIFADTSVTAERALSLEDHEITFTFLCESGVRAVNLLTAAVGPMELKQRGASQASNLRSLGYNALHLCDSDFANQILLAYGAEEVRDAFLTAPQDGVAVAGTEAMRILDVSTEALLRLCAGFPSEAQHELKQLPSAPGSTASPPPCCWTAFRIRLPRRSRSTLQAVLDQTRATPAEVAKLGYAFDSTRHALHASGTGS